MQKADSKVIPIKPIMHGLILVVIYLALIAFHGYRFGDEDMTETLSYALYMNDHSLYPHDLYIQAVGPHALNERFPFTYLLALFDYPLDWPCFLLHLTTTFLLLAGLWQIAGIYLKAPGSRILLLFVTLFVTYHLNLGGNEIWYNYYVPSHLAKAIAIWGLLYWLTNRRITAYLLISLATFAQPVVGAQLALIFMLVDLGQWKKDKFRVFTGPLLYGLTAGIWIVSIFMSHLVKDQSISNAAFYNIMEARLAHHFFPSYFPMRSWIILLPLFVIGGYFARWIDQKIFQFFLWAFAGMLLYFIGIEWLEVPALLSVQWFKITIWLKPLALLVLIKLIDSSVEKIPIRWIQWSMVPVALLALLNIAGVIHSFGDKPMHLPGTTFYNEEMEIGLQMKNVLPSDICVIIPPDVTGIRYFSERSIYVDYKSNIHNKTYMAEAALRRKELYGLDLEMRKSNQDIMQAEKRHFELLNENDFSLYRQKGVTHILVKNSQLLKLKKVISNSLFTLYQL
ncbi:MAG: hypothetical protein IPL46_24810 [Saprospiraceae bacterium]|nr:hypothetical protein [Saprospiraceae bacterium]